MDMITKYRLLVGLLATVAAMPAPALSQAPVSQTSAATPVRRTVVADPAIRTGTLPNGLRYFIGRNAVPAGGLSLRLGIDVGSFEEGEAERGFAHFVEHLAFRTTKSAPDGGLDRRFASFGVAFGRDQNAATTPFATSYRLDFAGTNAAGIDAGFAWLRDVADGITFSDAGVAVERGVVLAEIDARESPQAAISEALARFQAPGLRTVDRLPGGTRSSVGGAKAATLRAYYDRWYRPEHSVLVVVGDQPIDAMEARIRAGFASWQGKGAPPLRARMNRVDLARGLDTFTAAAPTLPPIVSACRTRPPERRDVEDIARTTREVRAAIWRDILDARFKALVNAGNSGLLGAAVVGDDSHEFGATCLLTIPATAAGWERGLAATQAEFRRFERDGPTEAEVEAQVAEARATIRGEIGGADARTAPRIAESILARAIERRPFVSPREAMHAFNVAVEDLDAAAVKAAVAADWSGAGPFVALVLPTKVDGVTLRTAWTRGQQAAGLAAFADRAPTRWTYTDFGTPGTVATRTEIADPGFVRLTFANGTILNFKSSKLEANGVELRARFGAGRRELPDDGYVGAALGTGLLAAGGLGRLSAEDLERALRETSWAFEYQLGNDHYQFAKSTSVNNLPILLQVFAAFMSDPGFRSAVDERIPGAVDIMYRMAGSQPEAALGEAMLRAVDPGNPVQLPPPAAVAALRSADFARLLKATLTGAPVELTLVGDIDETTAIGMVARTLGALPTRTGGIAARADTRFLRFPARDFPVIRATHTGAADRAAASLIWPTYIAEPARRREEYALKLVAAVFNDELRRRIRTELGKTYDPSVVTVMPDFADQGYLAVQVASAPADIDLLVAQSRALAGRMAAGAITGEALDAIRKPMLTAAAASRERNDWWAAAMSGSARTTAITEELTGYEALLSAVTLDEVKAAAARWLARAPIVTVATPATGAKGAAR